jgi:phosphoglycerate dehydrogenase-like enzyme
VPVPSALERKPATRPEVVVTWPDYDADGATLGSALLNAGLGLRLEPKRTARSVRQVRALVSNAAGAIVSTDPFDESVFAGSPGLRVIARVGVGTDSIDLEAATRYGVAVTVTPGANEATVADHTLALMLGTLRRMVELDGLVRKGEWKRTGPHTPWTLSGSTVGIVGFGRTGRLVARRLAGFDVRLLMADPVQRGDGAAERVELQELLGASDVVSLHVPLVPSTHHLIGATELEAMKDGAILVNCARGGVVDEPALIRALVHGHLRGAGLDVFHEEPPRSPRLVRLPNVVLSPHVAGLSDKSVAEMTRRATASVIDVLNGGRPADVANPEVFDHPHFAADTSDAVTQGG